MKKILLTAFVAMILIVGCQKDYTPALKGEWLLGLGMKGLMCWDYDGDDPAGTLRKALWEATMKK